MSRQGKKTIAELQVRFGKDHKNVFENMFCKYIDKK